MASPRKPLNTPPPLEPKAKFTHCAFPSCKRAAHHWLRVARPNNRIIAIPLCTPCHKSLPAELLNLPDA